MVRIFRHYIAKNSLLLGLTDGLILVTAMYLAILAAMALDAQAAHTAGSILPRALIFAGTMITSMVLGGLYQPQLTEREWRVLVRLTASLAGGLLLLSVLFAFFPGLALSDAVLVSAFGLGVAGVGVVRWLYAHTDEGVERRRVLVLGAGTRALRLAELEQQSGGRFEIVGYLADTGGSHAPAARLLKDEGSLLAIARKYDVDEIVVGLRNRRGTLPIRELLQCKLQGISVCDLPSFFERETGRIQIEAVSPSWLVFSDGFAHGYLRHAIKRAFDVAASLLLLVLAWPVMAVTAILIRAEDGGPVFYRQERVGQDGRPFMLMKFRSMRVDAERDGRPQWARKNDDRVTRIGRVIRQVRIDELPQVFNVLRGDMSFVGPRPERPFFVTQLEQEISYYAYRHAIKPGITGWAQVRYPYGASVEDALQKLQYDLYYIKNHSLFLDIVILVHTARVLLTRAGAR